MSILTALNILSEHSALGAAYDSFEHHPVLKCLPSTYEDVQADIFKWIKSDSGHHMFWLNGYGGVGKLALAQIAAEHCTHEY